MKAAGLFSGGLDSLLAIKLVQKQGIDVFAISFTSPFFIDEEKKKKLEKIAEQQKFKIKFIDLGEDYLKLVRNPLHKHGKNMNPCIDCHAFMLRKAKEYADKIKAKFVFTGEVLNERPMSQNIQSLEVVEAQSGLKGKLLRPLSAKLLLETDAEKKGYVDREKLLDFNGRSRKPQISLAKRFKIKEYETPAGGCLLTCEGFSNKLKDLFDNKRKVSVKDVELIKYGRYFRHKKSIIIVGRNEKGNEQLLKLKSPKDYFLEVPSHGSPITILQGKDTEFAAQLTATYSDSEDKKVLVKYGKKKLSKDIVVKQIPKEKAKKYLID
ncbi:tRNA 4-thiouridine(8) synthase ThiI [Candidatus Woesearchaeota archaeon]|nr:tRNA 4-thiouridine(8) synthase ThiI [Candidatus Woesearchaeota archaeon]